MWKAFDALAAKLGSQTFDGLLEADVRILPTEDATELSA